MFLTNLKTTKKKNNLQYKNIEDTSQQVLFLYKNKYKPLDNKFLTILTVNIILYLLMIVILIQEYK